MAYSGSFTVVDYDLPGGGRYYVVTITETEAAAASEYEITGLPDIGTITLVQATLQSGTGTTIQPTWGRATGWAASTNNVVATIDTAAAHHHEQTKVRYTKAGGESLFGQSTVDAGSDNTIETILTIVEGHLA